MPYGTSRSRILGKRAGREAGKLDCEWGEVPLIHDD
jgi:hypothetical protein